MSNIFKFIMIIEVFQAFLPKKDARAASFGPLRPPFASAARRGKKKSTKAETFVLCGGPGRT